MPLLAQPALPSTQRDIVLYFIAALLLLAVGALAIAWSRREARRRDDL